MSAASAGASLVAVEHDGGQGGVDAHPDAAEAETGQPQRGEADQPAVAPHGHEAQPPRAVIAEQRQQEAGLGEGVGLQAARAQARPIPARPGAGRRGRRIARAPTRSRPHARLFARGGASASRAAPITAASRRRRGRRTTPGRPCDRRRRRGRRNRAGRGPWRIESLGHQRALLRLEGRRRLKLGLEAQEQRPRDRRQRFLDMGAQAVEIEFGDIVDHQSRHPGAAFVAGNRDAVDDGFFDALERRDRLGDLRGRDVLALPAKGVADPVDEVEIAAAVAPHQVAGAEPGVLRLEHAAQDLGRGRRRVGIAVEPRGGVARIVADLGQQLADLVRPAGAAAAVGVARVGLGVDVVGDQRHRETATPPRTECGRWRRA